VFTAFLDGFDCVTYLETILALTRASNVDDFIEWLRKIRFDQGRIRWERRNHYMTLWIRNNCTRRDYQAGFNAGGPYNQQGTCSECRTRTRCTADLLEMCTEGRIAAARSVFAERRSDVFRVHTQESRRFSCGIIVRLKPSTRCGCSAKAAQAIVTKLFMYRNQAVRRVIDPAP
jgi:hypothetical protein